jgi:hypothetical protein
VALNDEKRRTTMITKSLVIDQATVESRVILPALQLRSGL